MPRRAERILIVLLALEIVIFSITGRNFLSWSNAGEIVRLGVELGLLALAMTLVIVTGGIDLSVGALMSLCAVVCGMLWRDAGWPLAISVLAAIAAGALGGWLNAILITRFKQLPLIITLATFSLFRGIAEGATGAVKSYTGFPAAFLWLGQGRLFGIIPMQALIFLPAIAICWVLLERSVAGRGLYAIGHSEPAARFAGIPVERRLRLVYILSGLMSGIAAVIYVAHLGQAKSDAGTGFELMAITAAVLGGTSIFGGKGTIAGTMLGLAAIVVLQNGLRLSAMPAELAGILTGILLLASIAIERFTGGPRPATATPMPAGRRIALAVAGLAALACMIIIASKSGTATAGTGGRRIQLGMMPKAKGDPYFISCRKGAEEAARELNVDLIWDGPTDLDPAKQNEVLEAWITRGVDAIAVSVESQASISTVLRKARARGIKVITWDADAEPDARDYLIDQATAHGIGVTIADEVAKILGGKGEYAIITGSLTAANQIEWIKHIKARMAEKHPDVRLVGVQPSDSDRDRAFAETQTVLKVHPNVRAIAGIAAPTVPGAAEAVKQSGRTDVGVTGLSLPSLCKPYVHSGVIKSVVLWNTYDLGYLTVYASAALVNGTLKNGFKAGRLGTREIRGDHVMLGEPFIFTKANIDRFDF
jgi:rhamnose transport system substrate-binding protein